MVSRTIHPPSLALVALCLPVVVLAFVTRQPPQKFSRPLIPNSVTTSQAFVPSRKTSPSFGLLAKNKDDGDDDFDPLEDGDWEPGAEDGADVAEEDDGDEDEEFTDDGFNLDDVESSVKGEYDEDDIEYEDEEEEEVEEEIEEEEEEEEEEYEEEDYEEDGDTVDDDDIDLSELTSMKELEGIMKKREEPFEEGSSEWWKNYGFKTREDFDNHELFPGGMEGYMKNKLPQPPKGYWDDDQTMVDLTEANNDDEDDQDYNAILEGVVANSRKRKAAYEEKARFERLENPILLEGLDEEDAAELQTERELEQIDELSQALDAAIPEPDGDNEPVFLDASDFEGVDLMEEMKKSTALFDDEPYPSANRTDIAGTGLTDADMEALDTAWKNIKKAEDNEPFVTDNQVELARGPTFDYDKHPRQYHYDMQRVAVSIGSAGYNVFPWLKYDMDFNVTNLVLAAMKHSPDAPLILQHWYPQLSICERYQHARDIDFDFTWEDVQTANVTELEVYYKGFGYDEIPKKAPHETGLINFEEMDEQEVKMAAMEKWMLDIYNSEWDRKDFDDEDLKEHDNVFSDRFVMPKHPDLPDWDDVQEDIAKWKEEFEPAPSEEDIAYRDMMGRSIDYKDVTTDDFQKNFRGHLIIACGGSDEDLDDAEKITERMTQAYGESVYTETKIYEHATPEDNVFEVWLESYEVDLLHSRRRARLQIEGWEDKGDVTDEQLDYLVKEVGLLTNDDAKNNFRWTEEHVS